MNVFSKKAQAILELAIFGSILIMLLGALLNYGLRYNFAQKIKMTAFRQALRESTDPHLGGQASVTVLQDRHIPDPSNPSAVGSVTPFVSGASVIRSYKLNETADTDAELPRTTIQIQGQQFTYKTAGFRDISITSGLEKYKEIYGENNLKDLGSDVYRVIDSCEGEVISYDGCKRQCRMITQTDFCVRECERGKEPGSSKDCNAICNNQIETPWYCGSIDNIFNFAIATSKPKTMGLQPDYTKQTAMSNTLRKQESEGGITTTDTIDWSDTTYRDIIYNEHLNPDGTARPEINIRGDETGELTNRIPNSIGENTTQTWPPER